MTVCNVSAMIIFIIWCIKFLIIKYNNYIKIEVAFFISTFLDVVGTGEKREKGTTPKDWYPIYQVLGIH